MFFKNEVLREGDSGASLAGGDVQHQANVSAKIPMGSSIGDPPAEGGGFAVPEAYRDKPYMKGIDSEDALYKMVDGAQTLIGQKITFPTEQSTSEERLNFNRSAGMPEKADEYVFEKIGEEERIPEIDNKVKEMFHAAGISGKAATELQKTYETFVNESMAAKEAADETAFSELSSQILGEKVDQKIADAKVLIEESLPPELVETFKGLSNEALVTMTAFVNNFKAKYINEDNINDLNGGGGGSSGAAEMRKKAQELGASKAHNDPFHVDHKRVVEEVKALYAQIAKAS